MRPERVERQLAVLATRQYGIVERGQLRALGLTDAAIGRRVAAGRLHRLHRGVYAVGHPLLPRRGHWLAAVLACGPGAALSHTSAAALWEIRPTAATRIDVSVPSAGGRRERPGIRIHRTPSLETTTKAGIRVTTPERTILDLAATLSQRGLEKAIDQAEIHRLIDLPSIDALSRAHARRPGMARLRRVTEAPRALTRSELEERFLRLCRDHGLPVPRVNANLEGREVDFHFERGRVVVETDSWRYHRTRRAFEDDHARDAALTRAGYTTLRFTDRQLQRGDEVAATLRAALRSSG